VRLYTVLGQLAGATNAVWTTEGAGRDAKHSAVVDMQSLKPGIYFIMLTSGGQSLYQQFTKF
jgi:hypothetical protein